jgi:lipopolysaccharide/colanic/teichoic acid biosynthesis glycosyltransferase
MAMSPALDAAVQPIEVDGYPAELRIRRIAGFTGPIFRDPPATITPNPRVQFRRRLVHVPVAIAMLIVLSPLLLLIALLIKLSSRGPVIYTQTRVGVDRRGPGSGDGGGRRLVDYGGKLFTIYKFRTMSADPHRSVQTWAKPDDARVTRIGRVLRKYRLDELPQLVNVIRGDMNLVGPRPEQPNIVLRLRDAIDRYPERQRVLPGITGWAQINHHYDCTIEDVRTKLWYDLEYIHRQTVTHDLMILLRTIPIMVWQRGAW